MYMYRKESISEVITKANHIIELKTSYKYDNENENDALHYIQI